jgi:predicted ribosome quality control (RQC) complex YloA/Tae2 family protein
MKQKNRFDGLDVAAMTAQMQSLLGHKLANVYDGMALATSISSDSSGKSTFLFKLANPSSGNKESEKDGGADSNRNMLLIESGVRFHTTTFYTTSDNNTLPSPFAMKLRKHMRNLRLENVTQLGNLDRVVDFRFGSGERAHHLILELYGVGNIIMTDGRYVILALLRVHEYAATAADKEGDGDGEVKVRVGNVYPVTYATTIGKQVSVSHTSDRKEDTDQPLSQEEALLQELEGDQKITQQAPVLIKTSVLEMNGKEAYQWTKTELQAIVEKQTLQNKVLIPTGTNSNGRKQKQASKKKKDQDGSSSLKMLLLKPSSGVFHYGPSLIEHCILSAELDAGKKFTLETLEEVMPPSKWDTLIKSLRDEGSRIIDDFANSENKGYVLYREKPTKNKNDDSKTSELLNSMPHSDKIFEEFQPHLLKQHENMPMLTYDTFSMAVDEFFSLLEGQKRAIRAEAAEESALERLEKIKKDQSKRMDGLENEMEKVREHAQLVEMHADDVDKAIGVINSALDSGMDWTALFELVEVEKANMNPIALLMKKLHLDKDDIVLSLPDTMAWDQESEDAPPITDVTLSLKESAFGNARNMYDKYRISKDKAAKTAEASEKALKAAEANAQKQIEQAQKKKQMTYSVMMQPQRKQNWFEKFLWFITSDNYICIGGRDAQQNEQLVKRYLRPGDAYLHADVHGAPTCILRAKRRRIANGNTEVLPLSDQALREAGNFAICRSSAWASRMVTSAWWVESHQVSKTAPTGEYLTVGSFMIRGKKNFLPPVQLEMGMAVLFRLGDDASIARHQNDRRDFALMSLEPTDDQKLEKELKNNPTTTVKKNKSGKSSQDASEEKEAGTKPKALKKELIATREEGDAQAASNETIPTIDPNEKKKEKKGLSAKDRKLIKKYGSLEAAQEKLGKIRLEEEAIFKRKEALAVDKEEDNAEENTDSNSGNVRGKRSKKKKSRKYADQDDEDKELALLALQGGTKEKKKKGGRNIEAESTSQMKAAAETAALLVRDATKFVSKLPEEVRDSLAKTVTVNDDIRWDKLDAEVLELLLALDSLEAQKAAADRLLQLTETTRIDNFSASLAGIIRTINKYGHEGLQENEDVANGKKNQQRSRKTKAEKESEKEVWREILAEDGIIEGGEGEDNDAVVDDTAEISKLTGKPLPEDVVLYALPVCAPYATLVQYKYRVKLTPGSQKRGRASKQCLEMFYRTDDGTYKKDGGVNANARYTEMMKAVNDNEWIQSICGDVKISAAGASKAIKKSKAAKKGKAKKG